MSFVTKLFSDNSPQQANIERPSTVAQANQLYDQTQLGIKQQQSFVDAVNAQGGLANQNSVYQQLAGIANGTGPSVAQNQLAQATQANVANQAAVAAGVRGASQNAGLIARQAANAGAAAQNQATGQAATLRAQEQTNAINSMGQVATNQVNQQQAGLSNLNQFTQGAQGQVLNSINGQNSNAVSSQASVNAANAAVTQAQFGMVGQGLGAAGSALVKKAAHGGEITPVHGRFVESWNKHHGIKTEPKMMSDGGPVPGAAEVQGDNTKNDTVPTMLSPGEVVIPRSIMMSKDPVKAAAEFVQQVLAGKGPKPQEVASSQAFADGGDVKDLQSKYDMRAASNARSFAMPMGTMASMMGDSDPSVVDEQLNSMYGDDGAAPKNFDVGAGRQAIQDQKNSKDADIVRGMDDQAAKMKVAQDNDVRAQFGVPQIDLGQMVAPGAGQPQQPQGMGAPQAGAPQAPSDPYGYGAMSTSMAGGVGQMQAGIRDQAKAETQLAQNQSQVAGQQATELKTVHDRYEAEREKLTKERETLQQKYASGELDSDHYFKTMTGGEKVSTAIGLILGGLGAGVAGLKENPAMAFLQKQIDRDLDVQKGNLQKTDNLLKRNLEQFGNMRDAEAATRLMITDMYSAKLQKAAADAGSTAAKARAEQAAGKLQMDSAPIMQQMAMRKAIMGGAQAGQVAPEMVIRGIVPHEQQAAAYKELGEAQDAVKFRDNAIGIFDKIAGINTVGNRVGSPFQSGQQIAAMKGPIIAALSKATAGKFTEQDSGMLDPLMPTMLDNEKTLHMKRQGLMNLVNEKMNYPLLKSFGIDPMSAGRFQQNGQSKIQEMPVR